MEAMHKSSKRRMLLAWVIILGIGSVASAQHLQPFGPVSIEHYHDLQLFAPAELGDFGNQPDPHYGFFGSYERVNWHIGKPKGAVIGSADAAGIYNIDGNQAYQESSGTTNLLNASTGWGNRFDLGYMEDNNNGWLASVTTGLGNGQDFTMNNALVMFDDPNGYLAPNYIDRNGDGIDDDVDKDFQYGRYGIDHGTRTDLIDFLYPQEIVPGEAGTVEAGAVTSGDNSPITILPGGIVAESVQSVTLPSGQIEEVVVGFYYTYPFDGVIDPEAPGVILDPDTGDQISILARFDTLRANNKSSYDTAEVMRMYRFDRDQYGGVFEIYGGARFSQFNDQFRANMEGGYFDGTFVNNQVLNNMVGPQVGGRYSNQRGRWNVSVEGRYFAAANFQNTTQTSEVASQIVEYSGDPYVGSNESLFRNGLYANSSADSNYRKNFSSVGELRLNATYSLSKAVALKLGYTMNYMDNIARASNTVLYSLPSFGINRDQPGERLFVHGVNFGVEINR